MLKKSSPKTGPVPQPGERILFEAHQLILPTILNIEILTMLGFTLIILIAAVVFQFGAWEFVFVGGLYLILAFPSLMAIFRAGSTTYVLTNRQLLIFSAGFGQQNRAIALDEIQEAHCKAGMLQGLLGAGDVIVTLKGMRKAVRLTGITGCAERARQITEYAQKTRLDRQ